MEAYIFTNIMRFDARHILLITCLFLAGPAKSQRVMRIGDARDQGMTTERMDSLYKSAFNTQDSSDNAFPGRMEEFLQTWPNTLQALGDSVHHLGFTHDRPIPVTYRVFFSPDGRIEHFHYSFRPPIDEAMVSRFRQGVERFVDGYIFPMRSEVPFKQCGRMVLQARPE